MNTEKTEENKYIEELNKALEKIQSLEKLLENQAKKKTSKKSTKKIVKKSIKKSQHTKKLKEENAPIFDVPTNTKKVQFTDNMFIDDGTLCQTDKTFNKKYGKYYQVSERNNPIVEMIDVKCEHCPNRTKLNKILLKWKRSNGGTDTPYWICSQCAIRGIKSK